MDEKALDTGYAWIDLAADHVYKCLTVVNANLGDFKTGYTQHLFEVIDLNCTESIPVVSSELATEAGVTHNIEVFVTKKPCALETCPVGEIQDLYTCGCKAMQPVLGELIDSSATGFNMIARLDINT